MEGEILVQNILQLAFPFLVAGKRPGNPVKQLQQGNGMIQKKKAAGRPFPDFRRLPEAENGYVLRDIWRVREQIGG